MSWYRKLGSPSSELCLYDHAHGHVRPYPSGGVVCELGLYDHAAHDHVRPYPSVSGVVIIFVELFAPHVCTRTPPLLER